MSNSPAAEARFLGAAQTAGRRALRKNELLGGDKIISVGEKPVANYREFAAMLAQQPDKALEITVERGTKDEDDRASRQLTRGRNPTS